MPNKDGAVQIYMSSYHMVVTLRSTNKDGAVQIYIPVWRD